MYHSGAIYKKSISLLLILAIVFTLCADALTALASSGTWSQTFNEQIISETVISESYIDEHITEEIYLKEIIVAESKISELLLEDEQIEEVVFCQTVYVSQANIEEFSSNSQTSQLLGPKVELAPLLKKMAVGTGVIVTLTILKKAGLAEPVVSVVAAAADSSMKFAQSGAAVGTLFGGLTGAADEIDESGRTSAAIAFATATVGLILSTVSLITTIPSAGTTTMTAALGFKLVVAGVGMLSATAGTSYAGYKAVKTFTSTDSSEIDWKHIDWNKVGASAAEKAIKNAADGYMWGAIIGAVYGGADEYFQKFNTPYTKYIDRLNKTPTKGGHWTGERGESDFILDKPIELKDGTKITRVTYKNAIPDFSPYQIAKVRIPNMNSKRDSNFKQADKALAEIWDKMKYQNRRWKARDVRNYWKENNLTWHEMSNMKSMQLVPAEVNSQFTHFGGVAEVNAMNGLKGALDFD